MVLNPIVLNPSVFRWKCEVAAEPRRKLAKDIPPTRIPTSRLLITIDQDMTIKMVSATAQIISFVLRFISTFPNCLISSSFNQW